MCVYVCVPENEKRRLLRQRERMISRSSFIPSCRERALQRNRCQSQYEEAPRFGLMSEAWSSTGFPRLCHSRAQIFRFFFFFFFSSYIYLPIYLDSFLCACAVRVKLRGQRTGVRVRSFHILYFGVESRTSNRRLVDFVRPFWTQIGKFQRRVTSRRLAYTNSRKIRPTASGTTSRLLKSLHD